MNDGAGFGVGVSAGASVVRRLQAGLKDGSVTLAPYALQPATIGGQSLKMGIIGHVKCIAPDGSVRWEDDLVFFDATASFSVTTGQVSPNQGD